MGVAGAGGVDITLHACGEAHSYSFEEEAECDACYGREGDAEFAEEWI